jgi:hypothetical protein
MVMVGLYLFCVLVNVMRNICLFLILSRYLLFCVGNQVISTLHIIEIDHQSADQHDWSCTMCTMSVCTCT